MWEEEEMFRMGVGKSREGFGNGKGEERIGKRMGISLESFGNEQEHGKREGGVWKRMGRGWEGFGNGERGEELGKGWERAGMDLGEGEKAGKRGRKELGRIWEWGRETEGKCLE